ncbi:MAG: diaminopimelate dehydrogenase, partial [Clostridia bacterium]
PLSKIKDYARKIDIAIICSGSYKDTFGDGIELAQYFNTIDAYDNHNNLIKYIEEMNAIDKNTGHCALVCAGWDPGLLSINRALFSVFSENTNYTFWGKGVSLGHSNALRQIEGVSDAIAITTPDMRAMESAVNRKTNNIEEKELHSRVCYVSVTKNADKYKITKEIMEIPDYFLNETCEIKYVTDEYIQEMKKNSAHKGLVIGNSPDCQLYFGVNMDNNQDFTAKILCAYIKAIEKLYKSGQYGAFTCLDIPISYLTESRKFL